MRYARASRFLLFNFLTGARSLFRARDAFFGNTRERRLVIDIVKFAALYRAVLSRLYRILGRAMRISAETSKRATFITFAFRFSEPANRFLLSSELRDG